MTNRERNGRVFLDSASRPYWVRMWEGSPWLFYWHADNNWVSLREVSTMETIGFPDNLSEKEQDLYHEQAGTNPYVEEVEPCNHEGVVNEG